MPIIPNNPVAELARLTNRVTAVFQAPLSNAHFSLDSSGVAGFFGGDSAVAGMATVNLVPNRRWGGWYNTPGSYEIAKKFGPLARLKLCDGLFPGGEHDPTKLFGIDGKGGPPFIAAHSGTNFPRTGHLGHLIASKAHARDAERLVTNPERVTTRPTVTIVNLTHVPALTEHPHLPDKWRRSVYFALAPILVSVVGCVLCALVADWFCFVSIALGIVANGSACYVIGSGKLTFKHPKPAKDAPPGDGVLKGETEIVVLVGEEGAVNAFTRGHFILQYREESDETRCQGNGVSEPIPPPSSAQPGTAQRADNAHRSWKSQPRSFIPHQNLIAPCAFLLMAQFLVQLLLIPQGKLFGQLMFVATVIASWAYNTYLSSTNSEEIQTDILFDVLKLHEEDIQRYELNTWTAAVMFTCFVLASVHPIKDPRALLDGMLPNNTHVWRAWKNVMDKKLRNENLFQIGVETLFTEEDLKEDLNGLDTKDEELLRTFLGDACMAWEAWRNVRDSPQMSRLGRPQGPGDE